MPVPACHGSPFVDGGRADCIKLLPWPRRFGNAPMAQLTTPSSYSQSHAGRHANSNREEYADVHESVMLIHRAMIVPAGGREWHADCRYRSGDPLAPGSLQGH